MFPLIYFINCKKKKLIQRRFDGSENFTRNWTDYEDGFGSTESEFWLGMILVRKKTKKINLVKLVAEKHTYFKQKGQ